MTSLTQKRGELPVATIVFITHNKLILHNSFCFEASAIFLHASMRIHLVFSFCATVAFRGHPFAVVFLFLTALPLPWRRPPPPPPPTARRRATAFFPFGFAARLFVEALLFLLEFFRTATFFLLVAAAAAAANFNLFLAVTGCTTEEEEEEDFPRCRLRVAAFFAVVFPVVL